MLQSLGTTLTDEELATLYVQMDPSGDGNIDFDEFVSVMAQDPSDKQSPAEVAIAIFSAFWIGMSVFCNGCWCCWPYPLIVSCVG